MTLKKEAMNLNCSITQSVFAPPAIFSFNSTPLTPGIVAIMEHCTEMLQPSPHLCKTTEVENRHASSLPRRVCPIVEKQETISIECREEENKTGKTVCGVPIKNFCFGCVCELYGQEDYGMS